MEHWKIGLDLVLLTAGSVASFMWGRCVEYANFGSEGRGNVELQLEEGGFFLLSLGGLLQE